MVRLVRAPWSTNVERVALALAHKGVDVESLVIDKSDRRPVLELSGQPLVPVLDDGGVVVADSRRILRHLEATRPDPPLFPREPSHRAGVDIFIEWFDEVWKGSPNAITEAVEAGTADRGEVARHSERLDAWMDVFEGLLDGSDHLLGEFSAGDCVAFPFLKYAALEESPDDETFHHVLVEHLSLNGRPRVAAWIERVDQRPRV
ncbi:MAG TPA: glutathione S-transferase family protein [Thermoleophilaceae bacterium]|nr:glutathione S-transferase family protein [Thermoleophilaceae bacterium]